MTKHQDMTAIIYDKKGRVLSIGKNSYVKTHPLMHLHGMKVGLTEKKCQHAEISAIVKCRNLDKAHKIYVTRYDKHGNPLLAKPCPICLSAIMATSIKIIEHT